MIKPLIVLPAEPAPTLSPFALPALMPLSSICNTASFPVERVLTEEPVWVYPSIVTTPVMVGKAEVGLIVCTPAPAMLK